MQDAFNGRMAFQEAGNDQAVLHVILHANPKRFESTIHHVTIKRGMAQLQ